MDEHAELLRFSVVAAYRAVAGLAEGARAEDDTPNGATLVTVGEIIGALMSPDGVDDAFAEARRRLASASGPTKEEVLQDAVNVLSDLILAAASSHVSARDGLEELVAREAPPAAANSGAEWVRKVAVQKLATDRARAAHLQGQRTDAHEWLRTFTSSEQADVFLAAWDSPASQAADAATKTAQQDVSTEWLHRPDTVAGQYQEQRPTVRQRKPIIVGAAVVLVGLVGWLVVGSGDDGPATEAELPASVEGLVAVCQANTAFTSAPSYVAGPGEHPIALIHERYGSLKNDVSAENESESESSEDLSWDSPLSAAWRPSDPSEVELVACFNENRDETYQGDPVSSCGGYSVGFDPSRGGGPITVDVYALVYDVVVYEARTRELVEETTLVAMGQSECPESLQWDGDSTPRLNTHSTTDDWVDALGHLVDQ